MELSPDPKKQGSAQEDVREFKELSARAAQLPGEVDPALLQRIKDRLESHTTDSQAVIPGRLGLLIPLLSEPSLQQQLVQTLLGPDRDGALVALSMLQLVCTAESKAVLMTYACEPAHPISVRIRCVLALKACSDDASVAQMLVELSYNPDLACLRQAVAQALIPYRSAPTDIATARLWELASDDTDSETRRRATLELFSRQELLSPEVLARILEGPCDLNAFTLGLPMHTSEWSPTLIQRVLQVHKSAPGPKPWEVISACDSSLAQQCKDFPRTTATSLIAALRTLQESGLLRGKTTDLVVSHLRPIIKAPCDGWSAADKEAVLELVTLINISITSPDARTKSSLTPGEVVTFFESLVANNYLPERMYGPGFVELLKTLPAEFTPLLQTGFLRSSVFKQLAGSAELFSFLASLPGDANFAAQFFDSALNDSSQLKFAPYLAQAFAYIAKQQKSWNLSDFKQINLVDLMRALHLYRGPDADQVKTLVENEYQKLTAANLPYQLYLALNRPHTSRGPNCPWQSFPVIDVSREASPSLPPSVCPFTAQQILNATERISSLINERLKDETTVLGYTFGGMFLRFEGAPASTYAERFATTQKVVSDASERIESLIAEMRSLSPELQDIPQGVLLVGRDRLAEELDRIGIKGAKRSSVLKLTDSIEAIQKEVDESMRFCLAHLSERILKSCQLMDAGLVASSSLASNFAPTPIGGLIMCAAAALVDRSQLTPLPEVVFSQTLSHFNDAAVTLSRFFSSFWTGDASIAERAMTCVGEHINGDSVEVVERSYEGSSWVIDSKQSGIPIPKHLEDIAYMTVSAGMASACPGTFLLKDFWNIRNFEELETLWLSEPTGRQREMVQTLLRYASIQLRLPGFDEYLKSTEFQNNLVRIVNSRIPDEFKDVAVLALTNYGCAEYGHVNLHPSCITALVKGASTEGNAVTQIYNIRSIPDLYILEQLRKLPLRGNAGAAAHKKLSAVTEIIEQSGSRDVRLEMAKKLFPALLQGSSKHDFIREAILRALGRVPDQEYLLSEMGSCLALVDVALDWTKSPHTATLSLTGDNALSAEALACYDLLEFLFKHESSSDQAVARGASFLLQYIFG